MTNVQAWFETTEVEPGIHAIEEPFHVERVKSYLVTGEDRAILVDTGMGVANIRDEVGRLTGLPVTVINSHAHWDHIGGNALFDDILIHPAEADELLPVTVQIWGDGFPPGHRGRRMGACSICTMPHATT
jgi:glyoxylase-like metal-dependent hydrolase (beta-lactamase superfamily II)